MPARAAEDPGEVADPCREEKCTRLAVHPAHPWDFYRLPRGEWVPCPACRGGDPEGACNHCGNVGAVPRRRAREILEELRGR